MNDLAPLRVLIADDHTALRLGLASIVATMGQATVVGEAADGEEAVAQYRALQPDVMTLELRMPRLDGVQVVGRIVEADPAARILVMTTQDREEDVFGSIRAGAKGYILKSASCAEIVTALRAVGGGGRYIPESVALTLAARLAAPSLSRREREVLNHLRAGFSNKEIGRTLGVTEGTVKNHVLRVLAKLGAASRTEAVNLALQRGLLK